MSESVPDFGSGPGEEKVPEIGSNSSLSSMAGSFMALANPLKDVAFNVDASLCRPRPSEPDHRKTVIVAIILAFTLFSIVFQVRHIYTH